jgi:choline dehydrogenase
MGRGDDPGAVVDPDCRVIGVDRLRLADSSVFPRDHQRQSQRAVDHGGREGADHILGRAPLPPISSPGPIRTGRRPTA